MGRTASTVLNLAVDAVFYNTAIVLAFVVRLGWPIPDFDFEAYETVVIPLTLGQLLIFFLVGLYDPAADRSAPELLGTVVKGLLLGVLALIALTFVFRAFSFPRSVVVLSFLAGLLLLWGWRRVASNLLHVKWPERRVVLGWSWWGPVLTPAWFSTDYRWRRTGATESLVSWCPVRETRKTRSPRQLRRTRLLVPAPQA